MKHIYISLLLTAALPLCSYAQDNVGSRNAEGYYVANLPYSESFDNYGGNYDGTSMLPNGWFASGDEPFLTATSSMRDAHTGTYYLVTIETSGPRLDRAYTPYFEVEAGKTYELSYWTWMPGNSFYPTQNTLTLTAGTEQEAEFQTTKIYETTANTGKEWKEHTAKYTAMETGLVCFCFTLTTDDQLAGYVAIDDLSITADEQEVPPTADFAVTTLSSLMTGTYICYPGQLVKLTNLSKHATEYFWEMPGCTPSSSTQAEPTFYITSTDNYNISLHAKNRSGEAVATQNVAIEYMDYDGTLGLQTFEADSKTIDRGYIPCYTTDKEADFYSGANHYYRQIAQRVDQSPIQECTITQLNYQLTNYTLVPSTSQTTWPRQQEVPMSIAFYGETDGKPDPSKCFGRYDNTIGKIIGMYGIGVSTFKTIELPTPIQTKGTFYVAFEIGDEFLVDAPDPQIGRSQWAIEPIVHRSKETTMWVKPEENYLTEYFRPGTKAEWMRADIFNPELQGWGLFLYIWGSTKCPNLVGIDSSTNDNSLIYSSAPIYDLNGRITQPSQGITISNGRKVLH